jgi:hypothetical protein
MYDPQGIVKKFNLPQAHPGVCTRTPEEIESEGRDVARRLKRHSGPPPRLVPEPQARLMGGKPSASPNLGAFYSARFAELYATGKRITRCSSWVALQGLGMNQKVHRLSQRGKLVQCQWNRIF